MDITRGDFHQREAEGLIHSQVEDLRSELAEKDYELTSALDTIHERSLQLDEANAALAKLTKANAALTNERDLSTSSSRCESRPGSTLY